MAYPPYPIESPEQVQTSITVGWILPTRGDRSARRDTSATTRVYAVIKISSPHPAVLLPKEGEQDSSVVDGPSEVQKRRGREIGV